MNVGQRSHPGSETRLFREAFRAGSGRGTPRRRICMPTALLPTSNYANTPTVLDSALGANALIQTCRALRRLGIKQIRTPYRSPRANAVGERWVKSARSECLDHLFIFSEAGLRRDLSAYVSYFNHWRPHRSIGQRTPRDPEEPRSPSQRKSGKIIADPVLGGLHHVYKLAA